MEGETRRGLHDSGSRRTFNTGAQRDRDEGKIRPDLISPFSLRRVGRIMMLGAKKYSPRNWEKGMPMSEFFASAERHRLAYLAKEMSEDHLAQWAWNVLAMLHIEEVVRLGILPEELNDMPDYRARIVVRGTLGEAADEVLRNLDLPSTPASTNQPEKPLMGRITKAILGGAKRGDLFGVHFRELGLKRGIHGVITDIVDGAMRVECDSCHSKYIVDDTETYRRMD